MKKLRYLFVFLLFLMVAASLWAWFQVGTRPDKIGLHRCNSLEKLREVGAGYNLIEVDVCIRPDGTLDVTHDEDTTFGLDIAPYFAYLQERPEATLWLDVKNLDDSLQVPFFITLDSLRRTHELSPERLIVESKRWDLMRPLTLRSYGTSYYVDAPKPSDLTRRQTDSVITRLDRVASSGCVLALSFPGWWYPVLRNQFGESEVDFLVWKHRTTQWEFFLNPLNHLMLNDERVKTILVKNKGNFHR